MSKEQATKKVVSVEEQNMIDLVERSRKKLRDRGTPHVELIPDEVVVSLAKDFCKMETKIETALAEKQDIASAIEKSIRDKKKVVLDLARKINPLVVASIENNPSKSFSKSIALNDGTLTVNLTAYQDVERPEIESMKSAKETIGQELNSFAESIGLKNLKDLMLVKKGTKTNSSLTVFSLLDKTDERQKLFDRIPLKVENIRYNMSIQWKDRQEK